MAKKHNSGPLERGSKIDDTWTDQVTDLDFGNLDKVEGV